jgi:hypothetical protein
MPRKPRLLLCDAVAIITAHAEGVWDSLCVSYEVLVPSIVVAEAHFYRDQAGRRIPIDLQCDIDSGKVSEYTANLVELAATGSMLHPGLRARVDDGEREALTYLRQSPGDDVWFITADGGAIQAERSLSTAANAPNRWQPHCNASASRRTFRGTTRTSSCGNTVVSAASS